VIKTSGKSKITFIGHSQGNSQMFSALAENYGGIQSKLNLFLAFAPAVYLNNTKSSLLQAAAKNNKSLEKSEWVLKTYALNKSPTDGKIFCGWYSSVCKGITEYLHIDGSPYNNESRSIVEEQRPLSNSSLRDVIHFGQIASTGKFNRYDYNSP